MSFLRTFVLRGPDQWKSLTAFLKQNAAEMARQGQPMEVRCSIYKDKRSNAQNALMWSLLQIIADQARVGGRSFDSEVWHEHFKRELLPDETARGVAKWKVLPNGHRDLFMGTTDLDVAEFTTYLDKLQAYAVTELGVEFNHTQPA